MDHLMQPKQDPASTLIKNLYVLYIHLGKLVQFISWPSYFMAIW